MKRNVLKFKSIFDETIHFAQNKQITEIQFIELP